MNRQPTNRPRPSGGGSSYSRPSGARPGYGQPSGNRSRYGQAPGARPGANRPAGAGSRFGGRTDAGTGYGRPVNAGSPRNRTSGAGPTPNRAPVRRPPRRRGGGIFASLRRGLNRLNRRLDVFRGSEVSAVVFNSLLAAVALVIALSILVLFAPNLRMTWMRILTATGRVDSAEAVIEALEGDGFSAEKLADARGSLADRLIELGRFKDADEQISAMPESGERRELSNRSRYGQADELYRSGDYSAAAQQFYQLGEYSDSALRYADCRCALAIQRYRAGDEEGARQSLISVDGVDSRIAAVALQVTGSESEAQALLATDAFNPASLAQMEASVAQLRAARDSMPGGRIAAGFAHTVGLRGDGTVLATGDNSQGQCNLSGWSGITQLAAGAYHTVGLRSDGTVVAAGNNEQGQCDVSGWSDITAVAATAYGTLGLKSDGTVVACGMDSDAVSGWRDVKQIAGGSYTAACIYGEGNVMSTHTGAQLEMNAALCDLSVCGPVAAGVLLDGSMITNFDGAPQWSGLASISLDENGILGVTGDGQALRYTYRSAQSETLPVEGTAIEAEGGGTHWVVLTAEGRAFAFGDNDSGQCNVSDWQL